MSELIKNVEWIIDVSIFTSATPAALIWQDFRRTLATGRLDKMGHVLPADVALVDVGHLHDQSHPDCIPYDILTHARMEFGDLIGNDAGSIHLPHPYTALLHRYREANGQVIALIIGVERVAGVAVTPAGDVQRAPGPVFLCYAHIENRWHDPASFQLERGPSQSEWQLDVSPGWPTHPKIMVGIMYATLSLLFARTGVTYHSRPVATPPNRKKPHPLAPKHVITLLIDPPALRSGLSSDTPFATEPRRIAGHLRAGCYVHYKSGKVGWRRPTSVNGGLSPSDYKLQSRAA